MKFKYFLRGLGMGIIFSAIICLMAFRGSDSNNLSDKEIIERAKELGMTEKKETVADMFATEESSESDIAMKENVTEESAKKEKTDATSEERTTEKNVTEENTRSKDSTDKTTEKKTTEKKTTEDKSTQESTTEKDTNHTGKTVTITIRGGSTSYPVCQELQQLGVIEDATDFDNYLIKNGYANRISVGTHTLKIGMTYEEIAVAISDPR